MISFFVRLTTLYGPVCLGFNLSCPYQYHDKQRILCMAQFLFFNVIILEIRLNQKGLLKRFSLDCYLLYDGTQKTIEKFVKKKLKI